MKNLFRHISGYIVGIFIFLFLIPFSLYELSVLFNQLLPVRFINNPNLQFLISLPFLLIGMTFLVWSNIALFFIGKGGPADGFNVAISPRTKKLVISGPYRLTRNPMVLGAFVTYLALTIYLDSLFCFLLLILFLFAVVFYLKKTEEKRLTKDFGREFEKYKNEVPMIFPFFKIRKETKKR